MSNQSFPLHELAEKFKEALQPAMQAVGNDAVNFSLDNFRKQGFQGATFTKWPNRKNNKYNKGRAILVQSGRLRRSIRITSVSSTQVKIGSDVPYAKIHNEGGSITHPARKQVLHFKTSKGRTLFSKVKGATHAQKVTVSTHVTKMPQRQFMGNSPVLTNKVQATFQQQFSKVIQGFKTV